MSQHRRQDGEDQSVSELDDEAEADLQLLARQHMDRLGSRMTVGMLFDIRDLVGGFEAFIADTDVRRPSSSYTCTSRTTSQDRTCTGRQDRGLGTCRLLIPSQHVT